MTTLRQRQLARARNAAEGLPRILGGSGAYRAPGSPDSHTGMIFDPDHFQPRDAVPFDTISASTSVAAGTTSTLVTVTIPMGSRGILTSRLLAIPIDEDPTQWPNLTWGMYINDVLLAPGAAVFPMGTLVADEMHVVLVPGSIVTLKITNGAAVAVKCIGRLRGYSYPAGQ